MIDPDQWFIGDTGVPIQIGFTDGHLNGNPESTTWPTHIEFSAIKHGDAVDLATRSGSVVIYKATYGGGAPIPSCVWLRITAKIGVVAGGTPTPPWGYSWPDNGFSDTVTLTDTEIFSSGTHCIAVPVDPITGVAGIITSPNLGGNASGNPSGVASFGEIFDVAVEVVDSCP